jgi:peptide deformylase
MSLLSVLKYPDPKLKIIAMPVEHISPITRQFIKDMITTMYGTSSVGLTATQVGVHQRIAVIDVPESLVQPIVLINPVIAESKEEKISLRKNVFLYQEPVVLYTVQRK